MTILTFAATRESTKKISGKLFGANNIFTINPVGEDSTFAKALNLMSATGTRYPGGTVTEKYFDVRDPDRTTIDGKTVTPFSQFMTWAKSARSVVTIVLPTTGVFHDGKVDASKIADIAHFVETALTRYPDVQIAAFEIGNEYWGNGVNYTSTQYGMVADAIAISVQHSINATLGPKATQPEILVQMGSPWGPEYDTGPYAALSWDAKEAMANGEIMAQLTAAAREAIDGVIEHYYMDANSRIVGEALTFNDGALATATASSARSFENATTFINQEFQAWKKAFNKEISLNITEWNLSSTFTSQYGLKSASLLIEQAEAMIRMGVDTAHIWGVQINSPIDLAGSQGTAPSLSPAGAAFKLMSEALIGKTLVDGGISNNLLEVDAYVGDDSVIVFVSSRSASAQMAQLDLSTLIPDFSMVSGIRLGVDIATSDGKHYVGGNWIKTAYYNEHDVKAKLTDLTAAQLNGGNSLQLALDPFEVIRLVYTVPADSFPEQWASQAEAMIPTKTITGNAASNELFGTTGTDIIRGLAGNDTIKSGNGSDLVDGGSGNDWIWGEDGNDTLLGGTGADTLDGGAGADLLYGGDGDDSMVGGADDDTLRGDDGNDRLWGGLGNDLLEGGAGNDLLQGEDGDDTLFGGLGDDSLRGGMGNDVLWGGDGADLAYGYYGDDLIYGGAGNDTLWGDVGADRIWGEAGDDSLRGGADNDYLDGGDGNDLIYGDANDDTLIGGAGSDTLYGGAGNDQLTGGEDDDLLLGEDGDDLMGGGIGNDTLYGGNGNDTLNGFDGDDLLVGEAGNDMIVGGKGNDTMNGGLGADTMVGGQGNDLINGGGGADVIYGDTGNDTIYGGDGDDQVWGGQNDDWMTGNQGNDTLWGESGNDFVSGGMGDDWLHGGDGADVLYGDPGNDRLVGGKGNDMLTGGAGADVFIFTTGDGADTIQDFEVSVTGEVIDLRGVAAIAGWDDLLAAHMAQSGADTLIDAGNGDSIRLVGITMSALSASDFLF